MNNGLVAALERSLFAARIPLLILFVLITAVMVYFTLQLRVDAGFKKQLPLGHEYMQTFEKYEREFGGANRLLVAVMAEDGEMFDAEFFKTLQTVTDEVFFIPGVNRASVRSIFTPNVRFIEIVEGGFAGGNVIPADFDPQASNYDPSDEEFAQIRANIVKSGEVGRLVAEDFSGAMIWANLLEETADGERIDYQQVASQLEQIRTENSSDEISIHIIGFAKIVGDVAEGAASVVYFFGIAFVITAILLLLYSRSWQLTVLPLGCSLVAVIWQLGILELMGWGIDPMNILTPFLVFAIAVSHGVQMINAWGGQVAAGEDPENAARASFRRLAVPGGIALLSDTIGFLTILLIDIRIIRELATTASIGVALIILTNLVLLPLLLSLLSRRYAEKFHQRRAGRESRAQWLWRALASITRPVPAVVVVLVTAVLFAVGYQQSKQMRIGDSQAGVPELRPDSRYNRDAELISEEFSLGVDSITIVTEATQDACTEDFEALANIDQFAWHMRNVEGVQQVITLPWVAKTLNAGFNEGNIRWHVLPRNNFVMRQNLQMVETGRGLFNDRCTAIPVVLFTEDHRAETIERVVSAVKDYRAEFGAAALRGSGDPGSVAQQDLEAGEVTYRLATGNVGVMAATNEVVAAAQFPMLMFVYAAIIVLCVVTFWSLRGTLCIVIPLALVSVLAYALMAWLGIGLKVNTLPVVALGVGVGVDYGIYIFSRLHHYLRKEGLSLYDSYLKALGETGKAVIFTAFTLAIGVGTWIFSDLQFQADMGVLLAFMFFLNMVAAVLLIPALARCLLLRPRSQA